MNVENTISPKAATNHTPTNADIIVHANSGVALGYRASKIAEFKTICRSSFGEGLPDGRSPSSVAGYFSTLANPPARLRGYVGKDLACTCLDTPSRQGCHISPPNIQVSTKGRSLCGLRTLSRYVGRFYGTITEL